MPLSSTRAPKPQPGASPANSHEELFPTISEDPQPRQERSIFSAILATYLLQMRLLAANLPGGKVQSPAFLAETAATLHQS